LTTIRFDPERAQGRMRTPKKPMSLISGPLRMSIAAALTLLCGAVAAANDDSPAQLRSFIDQQVGGLDMLKVPARDADIPVSRQPDGSVNYRYQTTEAKRYLGKLLFHAPVRTARINLNQGQPVDLPLGRPSAAR
jgi:hypothetical protein